ncbi:MAG TPA: hypothetical protein VMW95_02510 [Desulfobacterales bacterium]|jgi:hypothetical protein|nr:hypothetical protein [Desulfobacterales bacterium]HUT43183.1 hypothetical protein [Desulfobacterales bacterium]
MSDIYFSNFQLEEDTEYFLYIGELKNYGLNTYLKEALSHIFSRKFNFIAIIPDVFEQYDYENLIVINPQFTHFRVPIEKGRDIVESMYGNISGDAIPRYIATAGGKIPLHRSNVVDHEGTDIVMKKPWSGEKVRYPDADPDEYASQNFSFTKR